MAESIIVTNKEGWLKGILTEVEQQMRDNNFEGVKAIVKGSIKGAIKTLEDTRAEWEVNNNPQGIKEKFILLRHNLNFLKRFCDGLI